VPAHTKKGNPSRPPTHIRNTSDANPPPHRHLTFGGGVIVVPQPECLTDSHAGVIQRGEQQPVARI